MDDDNDADADDDYFSWDETTQYLEEADPFHCTSKEQKCNWTKQITTIVAEILLSSPSNLKLVTCQ